MQNAFGWLGEQDPELARDAVEQNKQMEAQALQAQRELARLFYDVFGEGRGPELLERLRDTTIEMPLMSVNGVLGSQPEIGLGPAEWAYYREGQNSVVRFIELQMRNALRSENEEQTHDA